MTVQGPVKKQQPDGMSHRGLGMKLLLVSTKPSGNDSKHPEANIHGVCLFLCHNLGILYQILHWHLRRSGKKGCQIFLRTKFRHSKYRTFLPPGVVKQDKSSRGSVDTTKTHSGPQRVRMCSGERPIGATKGKQSDTEALCYPPPPTSS